MAAARAAPAHTCLLGKSTPGPGPCPGLPPAMPPEEAGPSQGSQLFQRRRRALGATVLGCSGSPRGTCAACFPAAKWVPGAPHHRGVGRQPSGPLSVSLPKAARAP